MRRSPLLCGVAASAVLAAAAAGLADGAAPAGTVANPIRATTSTTKGFSPRAVTVRPRSVVRFRNVDGARHSVVQDVLSGRPAFTSGRPTRGDFRITAPAKPGTYSYICKVHGFMRGTLIVKR